MVWDRGACWAAIYGVAQSWTWLTWLSSNCALCGKTKMRIKSSLLLHPLELVASFKFQNLSQFFNILTFDELKLLWLPLFNWFRDFIWPRYRVNVCVHAKSLQSCPTLCNPMDCSSPDSSVHGDSPGKNTGVGSCALLQGIFPTQDGTHGSCLLP